MINRTLFYWSRLYSSQVKRGRDYRDAKKTITINILNFNYIDSKKYHTTYHLYEDETKVMLTDILEIHFIELGKFLDENQSMNDSLSKWLTFLTRPQEVIKEVEEMEEPSIRKAITVLDMLSRDPETVRLAELRMKQIMDERSMVEGAREEGIKEGIQQGIQQGVEKGKKDTLIQVAISLLDILDDNTISIKTGLDIDTVKEIREKHINKV